MYEIHVDLIFQVMGYRSVYLQPQLSIATQTLILWVSIYHFYIPCWPHQFKQGSCLAKHSSTQWLY